MKISRIALSSQLAAWAALPLAAQHDHSAHGHPDVRLENVVITATPLERDQTRVAASTSVLFGDRLSDQLESTLGESLSTLPGIASSYFGPGASRPIIRGLDGDRIRILTNSLGTQDASVVSPDHAVAIDPLIIERIEVIRGPAALLYGGNAIGGVVNVLDHRIHHRTAERAVTGRFESRFSSVDEGDSQAGLIEGNLGNIAWHFDGYRRETDDIDIPGYAFSSAMLAEQVAERLEHGEPLDFAHGTLPNSGTRSDGAAAGVSFSSERGFIGLSFSGHNSNYGVPPGAHGHHEEEGENITEEAEEPAEAESSESVRIDLRQRRLDLQRELTDPLPGFHLAKLKAGISQYRHLELEGAEVGTVFENRGYDTRIELIQTPTPRINGAVGAQLSRAKFSATGEEAFVPSSQTDQYGLFVFEEMETSPVLYQFGVRLDHQRVKLRDLSAIEHEDTSISASAGAIWSFGEDWTLSGVLGHSERAPNVQELFADGPHVGTARYEIGNPNLSSETSISGEVSLRRKAGRVTGEISIFSYRFDGYIFPASSGQFDPVSELEILNYVQRDVTFYGGEAEAIFHLHADAAHSLDLRLGVDLVRAKTRQEDQSLPRITPRRARASLEYRKGGFSSGLGVVAVERARHLAPRELPTAGYVLINANVRYTFRHRGLETSLFVSGENLTDRTARNHVSFLKEIAPFPGRNLTTGVQLSF